MNFYIKPLFQYTVHYWFFSWLGKSWLGYFASRSHHAYRSHTSIFILSPLVYRSRSSDATSSLIWLYFNFCRCMIKIAVEQLNFLKWLRSFKLFMPWRIVNNKKQMGLLEHTGYNECEQFIRIIDNHESWNILESFLSLTSMVMDNWLVKNLSKAACRMKCWSRL